MAYYVHHTTISFISTSGRIFGNDKKNLVESAEEISEQIAELEQDNRAYISISLDPKQRTHGLFRIQSNVFSQDNHLIFKDVSR